MAPKNQWKYNKMLICTCVFGQMLSRHLTLEVIMSDITDVQNSLNINFTGIHALEHLFSVKFYEKWDQDEISRTILKIWLLIGNLVFVWGSFDA